MKEKYEFKNSLSLYGVGIALSIIAPCIFLYFIDLKKNPKTAIVVAVLGLINLIYYCFRFFDRKIKLVFDSEGIRTRHKFIQWGKVKNAEIRVTSRANRSSDFELIIHLKNGKETFIDINNLDLSEQKLKVIVDDFLKKDNN